MKKDIIPFIQRELSSLVDFNIGNWIDCHDEMLGSGIFGYDDQTNQINLKLFELGMVYSHKKLSFILKYDRLVSVDGLLTLPEIAKITKEQKLEKLVSLSLNVTESKKNMTIPVKLYTRLVPLLCKLIKQKKQQNK